MVQINRLCLEVLKVPSEWPALTEVYSECKGMKIAESLALAGDRGAYLLGLSDMQQEHKKALIEFMQLLGKLLLKHNSPDDIKKLRQELIFCLALLEIKMPIFWNKLTTHLLLHICDQLARISAFWAQNMLAIERFHVLLHNLARGSRNKLASLANKYDMYDITQTSWRFEHKFFLPAKQSSLASMRTVPEAMGEVKRRGRYARVARLSESDLLSVHALWATVNRDYDRLLDRYLRYKKKMKRARQVPVPMRQWRPSRGQLTDLETDWTRMSRIVQVLTHTVFLLLWCFWYKIVK